MGGFVLQSRDRTLRGAVADHSQHHDVHQVQIPERFKNLVATTT